MKSKNRLLFKLGQICSLLLLSPAAQAQNPMCQLQPNAYCQSADLRGANLQFAQLYESNFNGANLEKVNLQNAFLYNSSFEGANLQGA
ncbi:MAG: pentapeptide repeat-containing protein, partial [Burkholderiales bacterium]